MPYRPRPEAEEAPSRRDTAQHLRMIERWLHHAEEELLYAPDAQGEAAATPLEALSQILLRRSCRGNGPGLWKDDAAREEHCAAAVRPAAPASPLLGRCFIMGRRALPTHVSWAAAHALHPNRGRLTRCTPR
jgi:hypothetical protein